MKNFLIQDHDGDAFIEIGLTGTDLTERPLLNKGSAFTKQERDDFNLHGLLPPAYATIEQQLLRIREHYDHAGSDVKRYLYLAYLQTRNETLYYRFIVENLEELAPIVYTPTIGKICEQYSHLHTKRRGMYITPGDRDHIIRILRNHDYDGIDIIVVTDNERILGLGDLGAGGMGIPVGKLNLYVAGAGFHPARTLPLSLDVGTNNEALLNDPLYVGLRQKRITGETYDTFIENFVSAVTEVFPHAILQWEDFKKNNAIAILAKYKDRLSTFNDDIQGTAAIALATINGAMRTLNATFKDQRFVIMGGGGASYGIVQLIRIAMKRDGLADHEVSERILTIDSKGLILSDRTSLDEHKKELAIDPHMLTTWEKTHTPPSLEDVVKCYHPTILIGVCGQPRVFTEHVIKTMAQHVERPVILPLSNPTSKAEATPADILNWTNGNALVATGSPFDPFTLHERSFTISQANNVFIFPGIGMGAHIVGARRITDMMFFAAADAVSRLLTDADISAGQLLPRVADLRHISLEVAVAVALQAVKDEMAEPIDEEQIRKALKEKIWYPKYIPYRRC